MAASLTWLDFSDAERRRALQVVELFAMRETRDELGLGAIRDALADAMFPGISTVQRRARYFLFVPWIFLAAERSGGGDLLAATRKAELALVGVLAEGQDTDGVIGVRAGRRLQQLPSMIYWSGLERWGIRRRHGTREQWARARRGAAVTDDGERVGAWSWWHDNLVEPPDDFPGVASLTLTSAEGRYLIERISSSRPGSLLAWLAARPRPWTPVDYVWELPMLGELSPEHRRLVVHAGRFSEVMNGAALLYNLMLAEATDEADRREQYAAELGKWRRRDRSGWDVDDFWDLTSQVASTHDPRAHRFVNAWIGGAASEDPRDSNALRTLVREREHETKKRYARLSYEAARDTWRGSAGAGRLEFRWPSAQRQLLDIVTAAAGEDRDRAGPR